jgi:hypothetical protein
MEKDAFLALLKSPPEEYSIDQLNQLEALLGQHPYFQTAWALHLKALKPFDEVAYDRVLKRTAAHTSDREVLFEFITAEDFSPNHLAAGHPAHRKNRKEDSEGLVAMESADLEFAPAEEEEKTVATSEDLVEEPDWDAYASPAPDTEEEIAEETTEESFTLDEELEATSEEDSRTEEVSEEVEEELNEVEASEEVEEITTQESEEEWTPLTEAEMRSLGLLDDHTLVSEEAEIEESEEEELEEAREEPSSEMSEEAEPENLAIEEEALLEEFTEEVSDEMLEELALSESLEEVDETEPLSEEDEVMETSLSTPTEESALKEKPEPLAALESPEEPVGDQTPEAEAEVEPTQDSGDASPWYDQALTEEDQPSFALSGDSEPLADLEPITEEETEMDLIADATLSLANEDSDLNRNPMFQTDFELDEEEKEPTGPPAEKRSFSDWLHKTKSKKDDTPPAPHPRSDSERGRKFEILDRFLESNPKIIPVVSEEITVDIEESVQVNRSEIMTETLAQLYREQKKYKKALKGYEVLRLKYPEKSSFFAAQIQELKALIKEKKNKQ